VSDIEPTAIVVSPNYDEGLVSAALPVSINGEDITVELCLPPEIARDFAYSLTVTSMKIEEDRLP